MKDAHKRRRKAEREVTKPHPDIDSNHALIPNQQQRLASAGGFIKSVAVQGNELIATSNENWAVTVYALQDVTVNELSNIDATSNMDFVGEEVLTLKEIRPFWQRIPNSPMLDTDFDNGKSQMTGVTFITTDVIACTRTFGLISTWCTRTVQCLSTIAFRNVTFYNTATKLTETEFVVGSEEGHLCFISHNNGCNLKETKRIWKAHRASIRCAAVHGDTLVTGCSDWTTKVWCIRNQHNLAVLNQSEWVESVAISKDYIMTSCGAVGWRSEKKIRFYHNSDGYPIAKVFYGFGLFRPRFLSNSIATYLTWDSERNNIVFFDVEHERVIDVLKVAIEVVFDYEFLADGRIVAIGDGGGVLVDPPKHLRKLITSGNMDVSWCPKGKRFLTETLIVGLVAVVALFRFCRTVP